MSRKRYSLTREEKIRYAGILLLHFMIKNDHTFPVLLKGEDAQIEPVLQTLRKDGLVEVAGERFVVTEKGKRTTADFMADYANLLRELEVFQAVDLEEGEFAWSSFRDFASEDEWLDFLNEERWEDLRLAVMEYNNDTKTFRRKTFNPVEFVFMSFLNENRFDFDKPGWQAELLTGTIWDEILAICNSMLQWQDLGEEDVIEDIIHQGKKLTKELS